jgi:UDP-N-acetyl-D-galactosamine dehydrogenase
MGHFIAQRTIKEMIYDGHNILGSTVIVLGITFKENCPDIRNSRVIDVIRELQAYGVGVQVHDPLADPDEVAREFGFQLVPFEELKPASAVIVAVAHQQYVHLAVQTFRDLLNGSVFVDVKGAFPAETIREHGMRLWRL